MATEATKMTLTVPELWHRKTKAAAALRGMTMTALVQTAVDEWLTHHPIEEGDRHGEEEAPRK